MRADPGVYGARAMAKEPKAGATGRPITVNKRARHRFEVLDTLEAGISLLGSEVKSLRQGLVSLDEAYGRIEDGEVYLVGAHIQEYSHGNQLNHEPTRKRKLLLRGREIKRLVTRVTQQGFTLVPLSMYWTDRNLAKVELGLCRGRKTVDKREVLKRREARRDIGRDL